MAQKKADPFLLKLPPGVTLLNINEAPNVYIVSSSPIFIPGKEIGSTKLFFYIADPKKLNIDSLLKLQSVLFIQPVRKPVEEMVVNGSDLSLNNIFYAHYRFPFITGKGLTVSIKENLPDTLDIDFTKRFFKTGLESNTYSSHATIMATLIGGAGNTYYTGKGAAYKANLTSVSFQTLLPEHDSVYRKFKISVQNHSYGTGVENFYGADSYAYDLSINNNDSLLHIFSVGNSGTQTSTTGNYAGIAGFANLTGSFKQSKNSLSIGATDSFYNVESLSSKGPAYDGRIKPELVAFGQDGSSGAAALVSGSALLIQDDYKRIYGKLPSSALVRALLVNSADDIRQPGPDYTSGFGSLNTDRAVGAINNNQFFSGIATNGSSSDFPVQVGVFTKELKITLAWNDVAALPNATKALINNLDLEVIDVASGAIYLPWVLSSFPHQDSLNAIALRRKDTLNTLEQVTINLPGAGNYIIRVKGFFVQSSQPFYVVYDTNMINETWFTYPTKNDNLVPGSVNTIRFHYQTQWTNTGNIEISYNGGSSWETLGSAIDLSKQYYKAYIKDTVSIGRLRISFSTPVGNGIFLSDSIPITPRLQTTVGFTCTDSFSFYWNKLPNVSSYTVYALTDTFMRAQYQTIDTSITIHFNGIKYFAVAPDIGNKTGLRSYAFDYTTQGVGCFINSFLADPVGDSLVNLKALLGSRYQVKQITFQRLYSTTDIATFIVNQDTFITTDRITKEGVYYYRVKLLLNNGREVISDTVRVVIFKQNNFFVYPNPYLNGGKLIVQAKEYDNCSFELFTILGQKVHSQILKTNIEYLSLPQLQRGIYFYRIVQNNQRIFNGKLVVE